MEQEKKESAQFPEIRSLDQDQFVVSIVYRFIARAAPDELPLFQGISEAFLRNSNKILKKSRSVEDILSFGIGDVIPLLTPVALAIVTNVLTSETQKATESLGARIQSILKNWLQILFHTKRTGKTLMLPFTPDQLRLTREQTVLHARRSKLSEAQAQQLADAVIGGIVIAQSEKKE